MAPAKTVLARVVYSLIALVLVTCIFWIGPVLAGLCGMFMVILVSELWKPLGEEVYLGVWVAVYITTTILVCYADYRVRFTDRTLSRTAAALGVRFKRKSRDQEHTRSEQAN